MADNRLMKVDLTKDDLTKVCNALVLARASALRLSNRAGQVPTAVEAYRKEYDAINALLMRISHHATVS